MPRGIYPRKKKAELRAAKKPSAKKAALVDKILNARTELLNAHKKNVEAAIERFEAAVRADEMSGGGDPAFMDYNAAELEAARTYMNGVFAVLWREVFTQAPYEVQS